MKIICHGDSLTQGADLEKMYTWTSFLERNFRVPVLNHGIGGDTTAGMLSRFSHEVIQQQPSLVILMGGTNDLWWDLEINLIQANLSAMVSQAKYHEIAPVIGLPLPICIEKVEKQDWEPPAKGYEHLSTQIHKLVEALKAAAVQWEIPILDFNRPFLDDENTVKNDLFLDDGVHAAKEGHRIMGLYAATRLRELFLFA
ncbi:Lysophospholipase L1 [Desulfocicer vacuolatum DSM 3385]|uniref:Lysophospholipase L1 n=1 Tax=Desulfocicer vacuolatum DSM 3385 TaxID=1121400 RepID=A0A1W2BZ70_9BACT|nr:GDSL-type esterase/lipase family protein [Desulfocicer vacuolatum]SMC78285.1 Lysophospholipase L1 [Desulfocicer vacuolatum DSM 3385]